VHIRRFGVLQSFKNALAAFRAIRRSRTRGSTPADWFSGIDDAGWLWMNTVGRRRLNSIAALVPGLPDASIQSNYTGHADDSTLREGFAAYRLFKRSYEIHVGPLDSARVLDFGCGWGRIIRFFLRDLPPERLKGVDHSAEGIEACRATNRWCSFELIEPHPPTPFPDESFDLIYLYSVFSHLPEQMHLELLEEFRRLLVSGGLLVATTWGRDFILQCDSLRHNPHSSAKLAWMHRAANVFRDTGTSLAAYDRGSFCYSSYDEEGTRSFWGEACIPRAYVEHRWQQFFEICDYIEDRSVCPQNMIIARKTRV
jgi:SAM-dependent methyltransferase